MHYGPMWPVEISGFFSQATDSPLAQSLWGSNQSLVITVFAGERLNIKMPSYQ